MNDAFGLVGGLIVAILLLENIDRHVSTFQQQPLPAPDPDAADDNLVTPPGATSHPAGTPPGDPTSGDPTSDPADEQQHRFDFGPF
ncbi:hypothetical protein JCGZ_24121 [Jatropha curcas]|uniref:Uncharacterized protein n=1 Tax=Jatropha curcas TaxID=180498 RepID=A0A067L8W1_JATCU|nr:hypothetical protein JCGZ_24121 [Jatropha curcas]